MSESSGAQVVHKPWGEAFATFFTCLGLGPPLGGIIFAVCVAVLPAMSGVPQTGDSLLQDQFYVAVFLSLFSVPLSYMIGGIQAAVTGVSFAVYGWVRGRPPFWFALVTAAAAFACAAFIGVARVPDMLVPMTFIHAVPALLCWLIIRNFWQDKRA